MKKNFKTIVKEVIFRIIYYSGAKFEPKEEVFRSPIIFFAHRVADLAALDLEGAFFGSIPAQVLDRAKFIQRLQRLQRFFRFVSLDEALAGVEPGHGGRLAALTFDDCYREFLMVIQPLLEELGIPALYFITTEGLSRRELLWYDRVYSAMMGADRPLVVLGSLKGRSFSLATLEDKRVAAVELCQNLWHFDAARRDVIVLELVDQLGPGPLTSKDLYLSASDLAALARKPGVTVGSHTMSHPNLILLSEKDLIEELAASKTSLEKITGREVWHLSYPNGLWDERVAAAAEKCGYRSACATARGARGNLFALPRVNIGWWSEAEFMVRTSWGWT